MIRLRQTGSRTGRQTAMDHGVGEERTRGSSDEPLIDCCGTAAIENGRRVRLSRILQSEAGATIASVCDRLSRGQW